MQLEQKVAIVTGAATGIGKAIATQMAREGAAVVVDYVKGQQGKAQEVVSAIEHDGRRALAVEVDVTNEDQVKALIERAADTFGRLDIVVNNAGVEQEHPFLEMPRDVWNWVIAVDLTGPWLCSQAAARKMVEQRLSGPDFWTEAGIRTVPRGAPNYRPGRDPYYGLMGGVWVAVTFWCAFVASRFNPASMDRALAMSFENYSRDPRRNNTVPGQFSEWLHGETLVNEGMMLSPWFPPRYLWAAIEGAAGLNLEVDDAGSPRASLSPLPAPEWKWLGVQHLPYRGSYLTWLVVRTPDVQIYADYAFRASESANAYEEDITDRVNADGPDAAAMGFRRGDDLLLFVGNTGTNTTTSAVRVDGELRDAYSARLQQPDRQVEGP